MSDAFEDQLDNENFLAQLFRDLDGLNAEVGAGGDVAGAAVGAGLGAAGSFAALYGLGTVGLSAAGITSGLAAAGSILGGGMVAGVGVLAAPVAVLAVGGYAVMHHRKRQRVEALQRDVMHKAVSKQNEILQRLSNRASLTEREAIELEQRNLLLVQVIGQLQDKLEEA